MSERAQSRLIPRFILAIYFVVAAGWVCLIWIYRFIPLQDYPVWIYLGKMFSLLIRHQAPQCFSIILWPVPNAIQVVVLGGLDLFLNPETSGKIFLTLCVLLYMLGAYRLIVSVSDRRDSPLLLVPLLYVFHRSILVGELAFSLGLAILLLSMAYIFSTSRPRLWLVSVLSVLIFFSHGASFISWMIFLAVLAVFGRPRFRPIPILVAASPSVLLMGIYWVVRHHPHAAEEGPALSIRLVASSKLTAASVLSPVHFFSPFFRTDPNAIHWIAVLLNGGALVAALFVVIEWARRLRDRSEPASLDKRWRVCDATAISLLAAFLFVPFARITGISDINYRFILPMFLLMLASVAGSGFGRKSERLRWALTISTAIGAISVLCLYFVIVGRASGKIQEIHETLSKAQLGPDFRDLVNNDFEGTHVAAEGNSSRVLPVHSCLAYITYYLRTEEEIPSTILNTSIIRSSLTIPPLINKGGMMTASPSAIVIPGDQRLNRTNAQRIPGSYQVTADTDYVMILKRIEEHKSDIH